MPLIRYDTGDLAVVEKHKKYGKVITSIEAEEWILYLIHQDEISPHSVTVNMRNFIR